jgi:hypothetical protein
MALSAAKRYSNGYQLQVSYTLGKAIDDTTDFITDLQPANQLNLRAERSLSAFDQRHRLVISSVLDPIADITIAPIFTYSSGHPFNLLLGFDANGDTQANTDRPAFAGRNTGSGPNTINFDLRVAKEFAFGNDGDYRIEGIIEAFNLFNNEEKIGVNNTSWCNATTPGTCTTARNNFGTATSRASFLAPRTFRFTFLFRF